MTRHCPECGALVPLDSAPFCLSCGRGLPAGQAAEPATSEPQAAGLSWPADSERTVKLPAPEDPERTARLSADPERTVRLPAPADSERTVSLAAPGWSRQAAAGRVGPEEKNQQAVAGRYAPEATAAGSPLEEFFARGSAGPAAGRRSGKARPGLRPPATGRLGFGAIAGLVVMAFLLVVGIGTFVVKSSDLGGAASQAPAADTTSPRTARTLTPATELTQMAAVVDLSAAARNTVVSATDQVTSCSAAPSAAIIRIRAAVGRRRTAVDRLAALDVAAIPSGEIMRDYLRRALRLSIRADDDFIAWLGHLGSGGPCPVSTGTDSSYQAGLRASSEATAVKQRFVALWNPLAARLGQPRFDAIQI